MKASRSSLTRQLDERWAHLVKERDQFCQWCHQGGNGLNAAHIISRRFRATRWELTNGIALCVACHRRAHDLPVSFAEFIRERLGPDAYERLSAGPPPIQRVTIHWLREQLQRLHSSIPKTPTR